YVVLLPLALARTQDDKGRIRWTLFGGSEQGPARAFWRGFFTAPDRELPEDQSLGFFVQLLDLVYGEKVGSAAGLRAAGFRILAAGHDAEFPFWREDPLPSWTAQYLWSEGQPRRDIRFLLTFRPFANLPPAVQQAYLAGELHLLPFPGSLLFWFATSYRDL